MLETIRLATSQLSLRGKRSIISSLIKSRERVGDEVLSSYLAPLPQEMRVVAV